MATQVTLPGVGPVSQRGLMLGLGSAAVVVAIVWFRKKSSTPAATSTSTNPYDPNSPYYDPSLDPNSPYYNPNSIYGTGGGGGGGATGTTSTAITTNPQWTQAAMQALANVADPTALAQALGLYLTGQAVTSDQTLLVDEAIAAVGYPPVAGPNGYPPAIRTQPPGGQSGGGSGGGGGGTGGGSGGGSGGGQLPRPDQIYTVSVGRTSLAVAWSPVPGAASYDVEWRSGSTVAETGGAAWGQPVRVQGTQYTLNNLTPGRLYDVIVRGVDANGNTGLWVGNGDWQRTNR